MARIDLADHLGNDIAHVPAGDTVGQHGLILLTNPGPIDSVHVRIIEEVSHETPAIVKYLLPLLTRFHHRLHGGSLDDLVQLLAWLTLYDARLVVDTHQQLLAVRCHLHKADFLEDGLLLRFLCVGVEDLQVGLLTLTEVDQVVLIIHL